MAGGAGHHDAVRELRPVPRACFLFAGERLELEVLIAGIFGEAPQVCNKRILRGTCRFSGGGPARSDHWGRDFISVMMIDRDSLANHRKNIFTDKINLYPMNEIQYVYDASGNKKSVIIPFGLWEETLQAGKNRPAPCHPHDYFGIYRYIIKDPKGVSESLRNEWNRS